MLSFIYLSQSSIGIGTRIPKYFYVLEVVFWENGRKMLVNLSKGVCK